MTTVGSECQGRNYSIQYSTVLHNSTEEKRREGKGRFAKYPKVLMTQTVDCCSELSVGGAVNSWPSVTSLLLFYVVDIRFV